MSENETSIDTPEPEPVVTKKDPKKVEQGKRLAAISRETKERKMREKIEAEYNDNKPKYSRYVFQAISVVSTFGMVYMWFSSRNNNENELQPKHEHIQQRQQQQQQPTPKKFETFE